MKIRNTIAIIKPKCLTNCYGNFIMLNWLMRGTGMSQGLNVPVEQAIDDSGSGIWCSTSCNINWLFWLIHYSAFSSAKTMKH